MSTEIEFAKIETKLDYMIDNQINIRQDFKESQVEIKIDIEKIRKETNQNTTDITTMKGISRASFIWGGILGFAITTIITISFNYASIAENKPSIEVLQSQVNGLALRAEKADMRQNQILEILTATKGDKNVR